MKGKCAFLQYIRNLTEVLCNPFFSSDPLYYYYKFYLNQILLQNYFTMKNKGTFETTVLFFVILKELCFI